MYLSHSTFFFVAIIFFVIFHWIFEFSVQPTVFYGTDSPNIFTILFYNDATGVHWTVCKNVFHKKKIVQLLESVLCINLKNRCFPNLEHATCDWPWDKQLLSKFETYNCKEYPCTLVLIFEKFVLWSSNAMLYLNFNAINRPFF